MSCVLRRNPRRTDPSFVFTAVKKTAPSSREAIGPEVPDECPFSAPSPRGTLVQKSPTHAYSQVSLVSASVPRMGLCSSLLIEKSAPSSNTSEDLSFQKKKKFRTQNSELRTQNHKKKLKL